MSLGWWSVAVAAVAAVSLTVMLIADRRAKRRVLELELARQAGDLDARWEDWQQARSGRHRVGQPREVAALGMPPGAGRDPHPHTSSMFPGYAGNPRAGSLPARGATPGDGNTALSSQVATRGSGQEGEGDTGIANRAPKAWSPTPAKTWTDAASIGPVMWTVPGRPQAAPSKHGAPETGRMPRIRLVDDSTGGIRAVGDRIVAAIEAGEPLTQGGGN